MVHTLPKGSATRPSREPKNMSVIGKVKGRPRSGLDTIIAAVAEANGCVLVTDNERDFADIELINPLRGATR
jgi:hypothetical protein